MFQWRKFFFWSFHLKRLYNRVYDYFTRSLWCKRTMLHHQQQKFYDFLPEAIFDTIIFHVLSNVSVIHVYIPMYHVGIGYWSQCYVKNSQTFQWPPNSLFYSVGNESSVVRELILRTCSEPNIKLRSTWDWFSTHQKPRWIITSLI